MDNEAEVVEQEQDIIDLLASQSQEIDNDDVDGLPDDLPSDPDELKAVVKEYQERVAKRNKTIKMRTDATHRMQEELEALKVQLAEVKGSTTNASNVEAQKQEYNETLEKWRNSVEEDPTKAIEFTNWQMTEMQNKVADYIGTLQNKFESQLAEIKGEMNPERQKYRDKIAQARNIPEFADMDDDTILKIIQANSRVAPRGTVGGKRVEQKPTAERLKNEAAERAAAYFKNGF